MLRKYFVTIKHKQSFMGLKQNRIATFSTCKQISVKAKMKVLYLAGDLMEDFVVGSTLLWALLR